MMHDPESPRSPGSATVTRRTLAKGAAWTSPVLMVGIVAPAEAASPNCPPNCFGAGTPSPATWSAGGALVGSWAYAVNLGVTNTGGTCPNISAFRIAVGSNLTITSVTYANGFSEADTGSTSQGGLVNTGTSTTTLAFEGRNPYVSIVGLSAGVATEVCATLNLTVSRVGGAVVTCQVSGCWS